MKKSIITLLSIGLAGLAGHAAITIMGATTLNGSFESGTDANANNILVFSELDVWYNTGTGNQGGEAARNNLGTTGTINTGTWNAVLSDTGLGGARLHTAATTYAINEGDYFNVSFDWLDASGWEADDELRLRIVSFQGGDKTLENNTGIAWSYVLADSGLTGVWRTATGTSPTVDNFAATNGGLLYVQVYGANGAGTTGDFARFDNIVITAVPEPATFALLAGLATLGLVMYRRRKA